MVKLAKKTNAKKYSSQPEQLDHVIYEPQRIIAKLRNAGADDDTIKQAVVDYITNERQKCIDDVAYFAAHYGFVVGRGSSGIIPFEIEQYQDDLLKSFQNDKYVIVNKSRQLGVSTVLVFYALWFSIFSTGKRCLVVAHRRESAEEFITKLKTAYEFLPDWLKPSCTLYSKSTVEFDTKSVVKAITSNPHAARSFSATVFLVDEAAFIDDADEVIKGIMPTVSSGDGKLIAISSPNGNSDANWFYKTFTFAKAGLNGWRWFELPWHVCNAYVKNPKFKEEQIRLDNGNIDKFSQEYECFPAGSGVLTPNGISSIESLAVGDLVVSHSGRSRKILATMSKQYTGELYKISSIGSGIPIVCTPEHPIRILDPESHSYLWKAAKEITVGDLVVFPKTPMGRTKILSEPLVRLLAWYICEGSIAKTSTTLSLSYKAEERDRVVSILDALNLPHAEVHRTGISIQINDCEITDFLHTHCGSLAENKRIPWELISGNEDIFFDELMLGDGCCNTHNGLTKYVFTSVSKSLAYQVQLLAHSLDRKFAAGITMKPGGTETIMGRQVNCKDRYMVQIIPKTGVRKSSWLVRSKYSIGARVTKIEQVPFTGPVYNLSIDSDNSYIVEGRAVHNCNFNINLSSMFTRDALDAFQPDSNIKNKAFGGATYEDTFYIWDVAQPGHKYTIGVDCASNKASARDFTAFQVIDTETAEQMAEFFGKLPTEVFVDILVKAARHYNNALLVVEANSYSEMVCN